MSLLFGKTLQGDQIHPGFNFFGNEHKEIMKAASPCCGDCDNCESCNNEIPEEDDDPNARGGIEDCEEKHFVD